MFNQTQKNGVIPVVTFEPSAQTEESKKFSWLRFGSKENKKLDVESLMTLEKITKKLNKEIIIKRPNLPEVLPYSSPSDDHFFLKPGETPPPCNCIYWSMYFRAIVRSIEEEWLKALPEIHKKKEIMETNKLSKLHHVENDNGT